MARRPLLRPLTGRAPIARTPEVVRAAVGSALEALSPLVAVSRGLRRLASAGRRWWVVTPRERRGFTLLAVSVGVLAVTQLPYGAVLALIVLMAVAAWAGQDRAEAARRDRLGPLERLRRLRALYEALVPYFSRPDDPRPLYAHGGNWRRPFTAYQFDHAGRLTRLRLRYPPHFPDGDPYFRAGVEQLLRAKCGHGREYLLEWKQEANVLTVTAAAPLPTDICAQRFIAAPGETILGFTDPGSVQRTVPVSVGGTTRHAAPLVWRTGLRSREPHLLVLGLPGSGATTLMRSIALQALRHGDVLVVDGSGTGEHACLAGRAGVLAVESSPPGVLAALEWAAHETERRLSSVSRARQVGQPVPEDARRPLWLLLDRPTVLSHLAAVEGRPDPQELLRVPLRHGRTVGVTVVVADQLESAATLVEAVRTHAWARVVLGAASPEQIRDVLGAPPGTTPAPDVPPGRGYARLGAGPVHRLQVPATPDPYDDTASEVHRQAVAELLPPRTGAARPVAGRTPAHADG